MKNVYLILVAGLFLISTLMIPAFQAEDEEYSIKITKYVESSNSGAFEDGGITLNLDDPRWVTFRIIIDGLGQFSSTQVTDYLPEGLIFNQSYSITNGWPIPEINENDLIWNLGSNSSDWSEIIQFRADISRGFCGFVINTATAESMYFDGGPCCPEYLYDEDEAYVNIICEYEIESINLDKKVKSNYDIEFSDYTIVQNGDYLTYKMDVYSNITDTIISLCIQDNLPLSNGFDYISSYVVDEEGCFIPPSEYEFTINDNSIFWNFSYLNQFNLYTIYYCVEAIDCGVFENTGSALAFYYDGGPCCPIWKFSSDSTITEVLCSLDVFVDIKPGSWPNPINVKNKDVLPAAICGTDEFEVYDIDPETIQITLDPSLDGVYLKRWNYEDVATPWTGEDGGGHDENGDGFIDLSIKFDKQKVIQDLGLKDYEGQTIPLYIIGNLYSKENGQNIVGHDWVKII